MILLAIDPGINLSGVAIFDCKTLRSAGTRRRMPSSEPDSGPGRLLQMAQLFDGCAADCVVIELPQVYSLEHQKGRQSDIRDLATVVGAIGAQFLESEVRFVEPRSWKGQLPKDVCARRIDAELSSDEYNRVCWPAPSQQHNVYDAIGLGLWYLGRGNFGKGTP